MQLEANALKAMATDSTANYNAYQKLKENFDGQKIDIWNYTYGSGYYAKITIPRTMASSVLSMR